MGNRVAGLMNICPYCEHNNREGVLICERCGRSKSIFSNLPTRVIPEDHHTASPRWQGSDHFSTDSFVVLYVEDDRQPIILQLDQPTVLGRVNVEYYCNDNGNFFVHRNPDFQVKVNQLFIVLQKNRRKSIFCL